MNIFSKGNLPGVDYQLLKPSLQLASLLDTDCLLDFWHAIVFGDNRKVNEDYHGERWHWAYFLPWATLTARDRAVTRLRLRTLGQTFRFYKDKNLQNFDGVCQYKDPVAQSHLLERGDVRGIVEGIRYSEWMYERPRNAYAWAEHSGADYDAIEWVQSAQFEFAVLLVHEEAHAAVTSTVGTGELAIFEDNSMAEDGYDWEVHILDGRIKPKVNDTTLAIAE